ELAREHEANESCPPVTVRPLANIGTNIRLCTIAPLLLIGVVLSGVAGQRASAQTPAPGSLAAERNRLAEITGDSSWSPHTDSVPRRVRIPVIDHRMESWRIELSVVQPDLRAKWNSNIPFSLNDGPLWAGRGSNFS